MTKGQQTMLVNGLSLKGRAEGIGLHFITAFVCLDTLNPIKKHSSCSEEETKSAQR